MFARVWRIYRVSYSCSQVRQLGRAVKACVSGTHPKGRGFNSHSCHHFLQFYLPVFSSLIWFFLLTVVSIRVISHDKLTCQAVFCFQDSKAAVSSLCSSDSLKYSHAMLLLVFSLACLPLLSECQKLKPVPLQPLHSRGSPFRVSRRGCGLLPCAAAPLRALKLLRASAR